MYIYTLTFARPLKNRRLKVVPLLKKNGNSIISMKFVVLADNVEIVFRPIKVARDIQSQSVI